MKAFCWRVFKWSMLAAGVAAQTGCVSSEQGCSPAECECSCRARKTPSVQRELHPSPFAAPAETSNTMSDGAMGRLRLKVLLEPADAMAAFLEFEASAGEQRNEDWFDLCCFAVRRIGRGEWTKALQGHADAVGLPPEERRRLGEIVIRAVKVTESRSLPPHGDVPLRGDGPERIPD